MFSAFAFLGDFHPVAVHFPIALLPCILLLKLYDWRRPQPWLNDAVGVLLLLATGFSLLAVSLGLINREVNGHQGEAVDWHAWLGMSTMLAVALATALHFRSAQIAAALQGWRQPLAALAALALRLLRGLLWLGKWLLMILLFPLLLAWWMVRGLWRRTLGPALQPRLSGARRQIAQAIQAGWQRLRQLIARRRPSAANLAYAASLLLVLLTGLKGANLSHGEAHLTRNMPPALAAWLGAEDPAQANAQLDPAFYETKLLPAFRRSCIKCHGPDKQRAGLRLDSYAAATGSGVMRWQDAWGSEIIKRVLLPADDPAAMPPAGKSRPLRSADTAALIAWLQGHSLESLAQQDGGLPQDLRELADSLEPLDQSALQKLAQIDGLRVMRMAEHADLLIVNLSYVGDSQQQMALQALRPHAAYIVDLSWTDRDLRKQDWSQIAAMHNLRSLDLSRSLVEEQELRTLTGLASLQRLNLSGTRLGVGAEDIRALLPGLRNLYLPTMAETATEKS